MTSNDVGNCLLGCGAGNRRIIYYLQARGPGKLLLLIDDDDASAPRGRTHSFARSLTPLNALFVRPTVLNLIAVAARRSLSSPFLAVAGPRKKNASPRHTDCHTYLHVVILHDSVHASLHYAPRSRPR